MAVLSGLATAADQWRQWWDKRLPLHAATAAQIGPPCSPAAGLEASLVQITQIDPLIGDLLR